MKNKKTNGAADKPARGECCGACGEGLRSTKAVRAFVATFDVLDLRWVCAACAARGVVIVSAEASQRMAAVLRPFAAHLRRLAKPYEMNGDGRAVGLLQAADVLESGRAVPIDVEPAAAGGVHALLSSPEFRKDVEELSRDAPKLAASLGRTLGLDRKAAKQVVKLISEPDADELGGCETALLAVLASQTNALSRVELGLRAGYSVTSGGYSKALGRLRDKGLIAPAGVGGIVSTLAGRQVAPADHHDLPVDVVDYWASKVGGAMSTILLVATAAYPKALSRVELAERAGYRPTSGGYSKALGRLRKLHLLDDCRASDALMMSAKLPPHTTSRKEAP